VSFPVRIGIPAWRSLLGPFTTSGPFGIGADESGGELQTPRKSPGFGELPAGLPSDFLRRRPDIRRPSGNGIGNRPNRVSTAQLFEVFTDGLFRIPANQLDRSSGQQQPLGIGPRSTGPSSIQAHSGEHPALQGVQQETLARMKECSDVSEEVENSLVNLSRENPYRFLMESAASNDLAVSLPTNDIGGLQTYLSVIDARTRSTRQDESLKADRITP